MRIVSLNAWGGGMWDELAAWLPRVGADVVCLQEVVRSDGLQGWVTYADDDRTLPQRADLFADVADRLPRHQGTFLTSDRGPVTGTDGATHDHDFGIATFVADGLSIVGQEAGFVHGAHTVHRGGWPSGDRPRIAHAVRLVGRDGGRAVTVAHAHGLRDPAGKGDTPARRAQAERLAALVTRVAGPDDLVVVCGDLNLLPDSETFEILGQIGLTDLVGTADTRTSRYPKPVRHADYLLVNDPSAVRSFQVVADPEVSDHRALLLEA